VIDTLDGVIVELRHAVQNRPATPTSAARPSPFELHLPDQRLTDGGRIGRGMVDGDPAMTTS
jgi:hypothetical protein